MSSALHHLDRWVEAGLVDDSTARRIRQWESGHQPPALRWPIWVALAFGTILLAAGVLLFVSAHWDNLPPAGRFSLVAAALTAFHLAGAAAAVRFPALSIALHAGGTIALGGAIALTGQIFNISEHWPGALMMWSAGAAAGWAILKQWPQAILTAMLVPAWLAGEWLERQRHWSDTSQPVWVGLLALSLVYLGSRRAVGDSATRRGLGWLGGLALIPLGTVCAIIRDDRRSSDPWLMAAWAGAILMPLAVSIVLRRSEWLWSGVAVLWAAGLSVARNVPAEVLIYLWIAAGAAGLVWWGLHDSRAERIHLGIAAFAADVLVFYFSNVMDKLGRSASLAGLGLLFLGGGWLLERTRRGLMAQLEQDLSENAQ